MAIIYVETEPIRNRVTRDQVATEISAMQPRVRGEKPRVVRYKEGIFIRCGRLTLKYVRAILDENAVAINQITLIDSRKDTKIIYQRSHDHETTLLPSPGTGTIFDWRRPDGGIIFSARMEERREDELRAEKIYISNLGQIDATRAFVLDITLDYVTSMINSLGTLETPLHPWHLVSFVQNDKPEEPSLKPSLARLNDAVPSLAGGIWNCIHTFERGGDIASANHSLDETILATVVDKKAVGKLQSLVQEPTAQPLASGWD